MHIGIGLPSWSDNEHRLPPHRLVSYARTAEELGFNGLWFPDHLLKPDTYNRSWLEPHAAMSYIAGATDTLPLGTAILILPLRNPVIAAKQIATLQYLAEGRLTLGIGVGYYENEFAAANVPYETRGKRFSEYLDLLSCLLTEEAVTHSGTFYEIEDVTIEPRLDRSPRLLYGGGGINRDGERYVPQHVKRRLRVADGWLAHSGSEDVLENDWSEIAEDLEEHGQKPHHKAKVGTTQLHIVPNADSETAKEQQLSVFEQYVGEKRGREYIESHYVLGSVEDIRDRLAMYDRQGFDELVVLPAAESMRELDRQLEYWVDLFPEYF